MIGYLGGKMNKVKLLAGGMVFVAISCIMTALPYAIYGDNDLAHATKQHAYTNLLTNVTSMVSDNTEYCSADNFEDCSAESVKSHATIWPAYLIIWFCSFFYGIGHTIFYTLVFPYLDDNIKKDQSPLYLSVLASVRMIGPASGYALSSYVLSIYENPFDKPSDITPADPRYVA